MRSFFHRVLSLSLARRSTAAGLALLVVGVFVFLPTRPAFAQKEASSLGTAITRGVLGALKGVCLNGGAVGTPCPQEGAKEALDNIDETILSPLLQVTLITTLLDLFQYILDSLAYQAAVAIASAGPGQTALIERQSFEEVMKSFGTEVAAGVVDALGEVTDELGIGFDICTPPDSIIRTSLQLGIVQAYEPSARRPRCDFQAIQENWDGFLARAGEEANPTNFVLKNVAESFRPGASSLSAAIHLNLQVSEQVAITRQANIDKLLASDGYKDVVDPVTNTIRTPSSVIKRDFEEKVTNNKKESAQAQLNATLNNPDLILYMLGHTASVFTNTLISELLNRLYSGIFDFEPVENDIFNVEASDVAGRERATEALSSIVSATPRTITDYNLLSEFVVCPSGVTIRQPNNCVLDAGFASVLTRAEGGIAVTIAQAMSEGSLNGAWRLYGPDDPENSDATCYTYGYCHGNLAKLRRARIIPIGWELASELAGSGTFASETVTLQEVVDGFYDCNAEGAWDSRHPWCHLIDPNWVLKYPETQCRAYVNGETLLNRSTAGRGGSCADAVSCIEEDADGNCVGGYGYCTREKNAWRFRGEACPVQFAGCLSFQSTSGGERSAWILDTLDSADCTADNAGCLWYSTQKRLDLHGTASQADDTFEWLPTGASYDVFAHDLAVETGDSEPLTVSYGVGPLARSYETYAFEERVYHTAAAASCAPTAVGCSELIPVTPQTTLNLLRNPSFETDTDTSAASPGPDEWISTLASSSAWVIEDTDTSTPATTSHGSHALRLNGNTSANEITQTGLTLQPGAFYTLSAFARRSTATILGAFEMTLTLTHEDGSPVDLRGLSTTCSIVGSAHNTVQMGRAPSSTTFERFSCTFTTPVTDSEFFASFGIDGASNVFVDALQLEASSSLSGFRVGYGSTNPPATYLRLPPEWLNCTGAPTDPADCASYAPICSVADVGCASWSPTSVNGPSVPAVLSDVDRCPASCVGYNTYRQEATLYDDAENQVAFIPTTAQACTSANVGCDSFTNLLTEGVESYTLLRACVTPEMNSGDSFFTWEGSDTTGYQLRSWRFLGSNLPSTPSILYTQDSNGNSIRDALEPGSSVHDDTSPNGAPCTNWLVSSETTLVCADNRAALAADDTCNEHNDIFDDPDCREFYDENGEIHYRRFSETVSVDAACTSYRKTTSTASDCASSGGFWVGDLGVCRYFGLAAESQVCPVSAVGCRAYTGGASRNATTIVDLDFEEGTFAPFEGLSAVTLTVSNESVATDGHSLRMEAASVGAGVRIDSAFYDEDDPSATCPTTGGCSTTIDGEPLTCTIARGESTCGALVGELQRGKTYLLRFWAKGAGSLHAVFVDRPSGSLHDFVNPEIDDEDADDLFLSEALDLTEDWQLYELGPINTAGEAFENFSDAAALLFFTERSGDVTYLDNIRLIEAEENITLLKDSWVTPSVCDETPTGAPAPQYYLGCEAYTNQNDEQASLYQFTRLCQESHVGCSAFSRTEQSASAYAQAYNVTCVGDDSDVVTVRTACEVLGETVCEISPGESTCSFNWNGSLPVPLPDNVELGPSARVVPADRVVYAVEDGTSACTVAEAGCTEIGLPTWNQNRSQVTSFESVYRIDAPDTYATTLCGADALFCEAWESTQDGIFYFRNPLDQECEYKTGVTVGGSRYSGWFKMGSNEFCYATSHCSLDPDRLCSTDATCEAAGAGVCIQRYVASGNTAGIWRNGDPSYEGWAGSCPTSADLCTAFSDPLDTGSVSGGEATSYVVLNDEALSDERLSSAERCNGEASLLSGCVLFEDETNPALSFASSPTYLLSNEADRISGDSPGSLVPPVDCRLENGGLVTVSGVGEVDVCQNRCVYTLPSGVTLTAPGVELGPVGASGTRSAYASACLQDADCAARSDSAGQLQSGDCQVVPATFRFENDTNTIVKVERDRVCAEWLACSSSYSAWDPVAGRYRQVCEQLDTCTSYSSSGDASFCTEWTDPDPLTLDVERYAARDISWYGREYSGYALPNRLPVELYDQINIAPAFSCIREETGEVELNAFGAALSCEPSSVDDDCDPDENDPDGAFICETSSADYRLAYQAGACEAVDGASCQVGYCSQTLRPCVQGDTSDICDADEACVFGSCSASVGDSCTTASDCPAAAYAAQCIRGTCIYPVTSGGSPVGCFARTSCPSVDVDSDGINDVGCVPDALATQGSCFNESCLLSIEGTPFTSAQGEAQSCRGYPDVLSPFPTKIVSEWRNPSELQTAVDVNSLDQDAVPYTFRSGFQEASTCSPVCANEDCTEFEISDDCVCSYDKASYGGGALTRFYPPNTSQERLPEGLCLGGPNPGRACDPSVENACGNNGQCSPLTRKDAFEGWAGFCLERDSSLRVNGDVNDRPCLTWFPLDRLSGSADLYGQYTQAGFPLQNTYYCSEVAPYRDYYPTGAVWNIDNTVDGIAVACAESVRDADPLGAQYTWDTEHLEGDNDACEPEEYDSCWFQAKCPNGYIALVGTCESDRNVCSPSDADDDCPYMCIPIYSYRYDTGDKCDPTSEGLSTGGQRFQVRDWLREVGFDDDATSDHNSVGDLDSVTLDDVPGFYDSSEFNISYFGTPVYLVGDMLDAANFHEEDDTAGLPAYYDGGYEISQYKKCVARGVPSSITDPLRAGWSSAVGDGEGGNWLNIYDNTPPSSDSAHPTGFSAGGYDNLYYYTYGADSSLPTTGSVRSYLGCYELAQVSSEDREDPNKAWTNRVWSDIPNRVRNLFVTESPNAAFNDASGNEFEIWAASATTPAGQAAFEDYFFLGDTEATSQSFEDAFPLPALSCLGDPSGSASNIFSLGAKTIEDLPALCDINSYPAIAQYENGALLIDGDDPSHLAAPYERFPFNPGEENYTDPGYQINLGLVGSSQHSTTAAEHGVSVTGLLSQLFGKVYRVWRYEWQGIAGSGLPSFGRYVLTTTPDPFDLTNVGDTHGGFPTDINYGTPIAPHIASLGTCFGSLCREGREGRFTVNDRDEGNISGAGGAAHVTLKFFAWADENQMPLKNINVDWGAADPGSDIPWPPAPVGSTEDGNFYKNHRGLQSDSENETLCDGQTFGTSSNACDSAYFNFEKDYVCTRSLLATLQSEPACAFATDGTGRLVASPCTGGSIPGAEGACVFQPRVHVKDNWGWCTGLCTRNSQDSTPGCYGDIECAPLVCPGEGESACQDPDSGPFIINPWINYDGVITVLPR